MKSLFGAWIAAVTIVTYRSYRQGITTPNDAPLAAPLPAVYTSTILIYGALSLAPDSLTPLPGLIGWGLIVAMLLNLWGAPVKGPTPQAPVPLPSTKVVEGTSHVR